MAEPPVSIRSRAFRFRTAWAGGMVLVAMFALCVGSLPWTLKGRYYDQQYLKLHHHRPTSGPVTDQHLGSETLKQNPPWRVHMLLGTDAHGRSVLARCLLGGAISLSVGLLAAAISVIIGTTWGMIAGYAGGRVDAFMMRVVDVLYGLPYILLVILLSIAVGGMLDQYRAAQRKKIESPQMKDARQSWAEAQRRAEAAEAKLAKAPAGSDVSELKAELATWTERAEDRDPRPWLLVFVADHRWAVNLLTLMVAIGAVSWLTLARVVRGQVLSLKSQPFVESARAIGCSPARVLFRHVLPNLIGPVIVYTTLTVPEAILYESFLSFLGIGVQAPLPSWGNLAAEGLKEVNPIKSYTWLLLWPCLLLGLTLLALNFVGDGLRDRFDPRAARA